MARNSPTSWAACQLAWLSASVGLHGCLALSNDARATKKAHSAQLSTPANLTDAARQQSLLVRRARIQQQPGLQQAAAFINSRRAQGVSFRQFAGELNALGFTAPRGDLQTKASSTA